MTGPCTLFDPDILPTSYPESTFSIKDLSGAEEDASVLSMVLSDARATQSIHKEMIQRMADWEARQPGVLSNDEDLRNSFIANLEGLRTAFTDRNLSTVGVAAPLQLDRTNPAHAVLIAVRDDIADTRDQLQANRGQAVLAKQIADVSIGLPEMLARQAAKAAADAADALKTGAKAGGDAVKDFAKTLAWILGGGFALYLATQRGGGK